MGGTDFSTTLGRIGAGLQGNLAQFDEGLRRDRQDQITNQFAEQQAQQGAEDRQFAMEERDFKRQGMAAEQEEKLSEQRKTALLEDSFTIMQHLKSGNIEGAMTTAANRLDAIQQLGGNPADTVELMEKLQSGDISGAFDDVSTVVDFAQAQGLIDLPQAAKPDHRIIDGQVVTINPDGSAVASGVEGFQESQGKQFDRNLRAQANSIAQQRETRLGSKLSGGLEDAMLKASDRVVEANRSANGLVQLADQYEQLHIKGGVAGTVSETLKKLTGGQDAVSDLKRQFRAIRVSEGLQRLPVGAASEKDVELAFSGLPAENASPETVSKWLRATAAVARIDAGYNQFKSDFISTKETGKGMNQAWRKKVNSPKLERDIGIVDIYSTAQNRGMAPEDVARELGIGDLF